MLQSTLYSVRMNLKQSCAINDKRIDKLVEDMQHWRVGMLIYPSRIKSLLHISYEDTYVVLNIIREMGIVTLNFQVICSECHTIEHIPILSSLRKFPKGICCEKGHSLDRFKDTIILYRVIDDE